MKKTILMGMMVVATMFSCKDKEEVDPNEGKDCDCWEITGSWGNVNNSGTTAQNICDQRVGNFGKNSWGVWYINNKKVDGNYVINGDYICKE